MIYYQLFCIHNHSFVSTCGACLELVLHLNWSNLLWFVEGQSHFRTFLVCENEFDPQRINIDS